MEFQWLNCFPLLQPNGLCASHITQVQPCQCKFCLPPSHNMLFNGIEKLSFQDAFISVAGCCTLTKAKSVDHLMLLWNNKNQMRIVSVSLKNHIFKSCMWGSKQYQGLSVILNENLAQDLCSPDLIPWIPFLHPLPFLFPLHVCWDASVSFLYMIVLQVPVFPLLPFHLISSSLCSLTFLLGKVSATISSMLFSLTIRLILLCTSQSTA